MLLGDAKALQKPIRGVEFLFYYLLYGERAGTFLRDPSVSFLHFSPSVSWGRKGLFASEEPFKFFFATASAAVSLLSGVAFCFWAEG